MRTCRVCLFAVFAVVFSLSVRAGESAGETVLYRESFEKQIPGQPVKNWDRIFGNKDGATMRISNIRSTDGNQAAEFCNTGFSNYYAMNLPAQPPFRGTLRVAFNIFCSGAGSTLKFELREKKNSSRPFFYGSAGSELKLNTQLDKSFGRNAKKWAKCGTMKRDHWYRVTVRIPLTKNSGSMLELTLKDLKSGAKMKDTACMRTPDSPLMWYFGCGGQKAEYRIWLDEMEAVLEN